MPLLVAFPLWMQGNLFGLKVLDDFSEQADRKLIINRLAVCPYLKIKQMSKRLSARSARCAKKLCTWGSGLGHQR